ncbi:MAG: alpha/beta hydrolase-fold protein [Phycisphaerae bacterium]
MNRVRYALVVAAWLAVGPVLAASAEPVGTWTARQPIVGSTGETIHYYLFTPGKVDPARKYPLVVWLHGGLKSNGKGGPNMPTGAFYSPEHQGKQACFVLRPVAIKGKNWVSPRGAGAGSHKMPAKPAGSMVVLLELLEKIVAKNPIDTASMHVVGASMGGYGVWDLISRCPKKFASAIPICGGGDPTKAESIKHVRIWIFHSADDRIVPVRGSRDMFAALMKAKDEKPVVKDDERKTVSASADGRIRYTEYKSGGHNAWDRAMREPELLGWVFPRGKSAGGARPS